MQKGCRYFLLILLSLLYSSEMRAQSLDVRGIVRDAVTYEVLPSANILVQGTARGTTTNRNGIFEISLPPGEHELIVSYIGYKTERVQVNRAKTTLLIQLTPIIYILQEVSVYANSNSDADMNLSVTQLHQEQINQIVGISKDPLRAVQTLSGISVNNEASAKFNVRGGTSDENLILVNGVRVFEPFHLKEDPMTSISIFNIDMVRKIDFSSGSYSVEYGDALSSVLLVDYKTDVKEEFAGKINLSLIDWGFFLEGAPNSRASWMVGGRKSYLEFVMNNLGGESAAHPAFYDLQAQVHYEFSPGHTLRFTAIRSGDTYEYDPTTKIRQFWGRWRIRGENIDVLEDKTEFREADYRYDTDLFAFKFKNLLSKNLYSEAQVSFYDEKVRGTQSRFSEKNTTFQNNPQYFANQTWDGKFLEGNKIKAIEGQLSFVYQMSSNFMLKTGGLFRRLTYNENREFSETSVLESNVIQFPDTTVVIDPLDPALNDTSSFDVQSHKLAAYLEGNLQLLDGFFVRLGGRMDYFDMSKEWNWSPRLSFSYQLQNGGIIRLGVGTFRQFPAFRQLKYYEATQENTKSQQANHFILGYEQRFAQKWILKIEGYVKKYKDLLTVYRAGDGSLHYGKKENNAEGYARGIDLYGAYAWKGINAWLSYGLLVAREKPIAADATDYSYRYTDQRHTLSIGFSAHIGKGWEASLRGYYGSGYAYTPYHSVFDLELQIFKWVLGKKNSMHYPPYERLDVRLSKKLSIYQKPLFVFVDIINVFNRRNVFSYRYTYNLDGKPKREANILLPMVPTIGVTYSF